MSAFHCAIDVKGLDRKGLDRGVKVRVLEDGRSPLVRRSRSQLPGFGLAVALTTFAALAVVGSLSSVGQAAARGVASARTVSGPPYPSALIVKSELRLKANLVRDKLSRPPRLVFLGGSRSQRFDPAFARKRTGLSAVNLSLSCARPEAAWAYVNWLYKRSPGTRLRCIWGVQSGMMRDRDLDAALLQARRFYRYFPDELLASQRRLLPSSKAEMPKYYGFLRNRYSNRGLLIRNVYDVRRARGYTLKQSLDHYIEKMLRGRRAEAPIYTSRASSYFEQTLEFLNAHGTRPVIVLMPVHPRVLAVMRRHGMGGEREKFRSYLAGLETEYDIKVLDFTKISSFNGSRDWFYDGVHVTRRNANRIITAVRAMAGEYVK